MVKTKDIAEAVAAVHGMSVKEATGVVNTVLVNISNELVSGQDVQFSGFGTFKISHRKARMGRNLHTGEAIQIPASKSVSFKAAKKLKDAVNQ